MQVLCGIFALLVTAALNSDKIDFEKLPITGSELGPWARYYYLQPQPEILVGPLLGWSIISNEYIGHSTSY